MNNMNNMNNKNIIDTICEWVYGVSVSGMAGWMIGSFAAQVIWR